MGARSHLLEPHGDDFAWSLLEAAPDAMVMQTCWEPLYFPITSVSGR